MAGKQEEGTGKHKHKSAEEPFPHNEAETTKGKSAGGEQSGGKHETKSASSASSSKAESGGSQKASGKSEQGAKSDSEPAKSSEGGNDLKSREYTGPDGEVHHHTTKYAEQHKG